jgi:cyanate permease
MRYVLWVGAILFMLGVGLVRHDMTWQGIIVGWCGLGVLALVCWCAITSMSKDETNRR